jgi:hypothetical protein
LNVLSLYVALASESGTLGEDKALQSQWPATGLLHNLIDILRLQFVLEERIVEELPVDLGDLNLDVSILFISGSAMG